MDKFKDNWIRLGYSIIFVVLMFVAWLSRNWVVVDTSRFNMLSYFGTVITILGLMITLLEVIHSVLAAKSLQKQAKEILNGFKNREFNLLINELITSLEYVIADVDNKQYTVALRQLYSFHRAFTRAKTSYKDFYGENQKNIDDKINSIEKAISSLKFSKASTPVPNKVMIALSDDMIEVKRFFVDKQSSFGGL
ncbi:TPA: hypothetical protein MX214_004166 [Citrobacter sedlakii]|nr:hypothetical protein [Citrobacter sedlakii]HCA7137401.1 hypothetical protein [Citrobacter sedlakii]HCA7183535.1 hypothetical protein [Citrobacter sedlakii]